MEEKHGFQTDYHAAEDKERDGAVSGESPEIPAVFKGGVKGCTGGGHSDRNKDHDAGGKDYCTNVKLKQDDIELFNSFKAMQG